MDTDLRTKTINAFTWSFIERFGQQGMQFLISIVLARLLLPEEFGLIGMLTIFIAVAQSFIDSGFGEALIQKKNSTHIDECSIFYFNILLGFFLAVLLCILAPLIASFYSQPILSQLIRVLSLNLIINSFGLIHIAILTKQINFKTQFKVNVLATLISGSIGITMAIFGFGVWSLVFQSISHNLSKTFLLWLISKWRPMLAFSWNSLSKMFSFGSRLLVSGLLDTIFNNIYLLVIGKLFHPSYLGYYSRAKSLQQFPVANISGVISRVTFPVFASIQDDKKRLKKGVRKSLTMLVMFNFPIMIGLTITAKPIVVILLTEKWLPCVPYLQLLCIAGLLHPLHVINLNVLTAQGRSDLFLRLEILKKIIITIAIISTYNFGLAALIWGQIVTSIVAYFLNAYFSGTMIKYTIWDQIKDLSPYLILSIIMGCSIYGFKYLIVSNFFILIMIQIISGAILYSFFCYICRLSSFLDIVDIIKYKLLKIN